MILTADYHTHTPYSHGKGSVYENAEQAKKRGLSAIGITDHGFSHIAFQLKRKKVPALINECRQAESALGIRVLVGMESNILGEEGRTDMRESDYSSFDLFLAGKHVAVWYASPKDYFSYFLGNFVTDKLRRKPSASLVRTDTNAYIHAIKNNPIDILTHPNYLCYADMLEVAKCAEDYGTYLELNSKKVHLSDEELSKIVAKTNVRFVIDSDAHTSARVGDTLLVDELMQRVAVPKNRIDNIEGRFPSFRLTEWKKTHG